MVRLTITYITVLSIIAVILITSHLTIQSFLSEQKNDGHVINVAGRQRMLSQRITKYAILSNENPNNSEYLEELKKSFELFKTSHENLAGISNTMSLAYENSKEIQQRFIEITPSYNKIIEVASNLIERDTSLVNISDLLVAEKSFLPKMNDIVFVFDTENKQKIKSLSSIEKISLAVTLAILVLIGLLVFRPMVRRIKLSREEILQKSKTVQKTNEKLNKSQEELLQQNFILQQNQEELATQRDIVEERNSELTNYRKRISDSINSAKLIQNSILPTPSKIHTCFSDCFILYKPLDIVSGDFYWMHSENEKHIFVEADCTGHGVPGAFMTLIGNSILNQLIKVESVYSPARIMERMHELLNINLQQEETNNRDGMDLSIIVIEKTGENYNITFGAAGQSLFYTFDGELIEQKGSMKRVGGITNPNRRFQEHKIQLPKGAILYLASDGYIDQNDAKRKKYGKVAFKQLLKEVHTLPLVTQKERLTDQIQKHMYSTMQRDDITVIGLQL